MTGAFLVFALVVAGDRLWRQYDHYHTRFTDTSVVGLQTGSTVIYQGIDVGIVERIALDPEDIQSIIVTIRVERGTPIKEDARAQIVPVGITGTSQIQLSGGTRDAPALPPGSFIESERSVVAQATETVQSVLEGLEGVLLEISQVLARIEEDSVGNILARVDSMLEANEARVESILSEVNTVAAGLAGVAIEAEDLMSATRAGTEAVLERINSEISAVGLADMGEQMRELVGRSERVVAEVELIMRRNRGNIDRSLDLMHDTLRLLNNAAFQINADPSILVIPVERR